MENGRKLAGGDKVGPEVLVKRGLLFQHRARVALRVEHSYWKM